MEQNLIRTNMWNIAARYGLVLGVIASIYSLSTTLMADLENSAMLVRLITGILWTAKLVGCIWLMRYAMVSYVKSSDKISNADTFKLGVTTAVLSALVFAAFTFANISYISADLFDLQMEQAMTQMAPMMDSNSRAMVDTVLQNMPQISFFSNLIYCSIYGIVLAAVLSRNIPSKDPFSE